MNNSISEFTRHSMPLDQSMGRIVSVTGSKAIVILDSVALDGQHRTVERPEMGTLLGIDTPHTVCLAIVSALSVPVPAQREGEAEIRIAELGLVGELWKKPDKKRGAFARGVSIYPSLGDRVRVASKDELRAAFCGDAERSVRIGTIRQDASIPAMVRVDELLGKHFAILGTTGTGKSCSTALILRAILERNPNAHILLLDPHNEYATAFGNWAEVISPRTLQLPYWLLNFEEIVEVLIGDTNRKAEIEILQELIPIAKSRYGAGRNSDNQKLRRAATDHGRYTVDTPVPYRISDLTGLIDERMGKLENRRELAPYRQLRNCIDGISQDARYGFMFGSLTVYDGMSQILSRIFRVPVNDKPITILELTGLPTEIVNVVVSVLCRMTFDFALWSEGAIPVTLVCEEAHRYVPANSNVGFEPCKRAIAKIAKEGRKYGASLCIVTQRPAEIDPTILSQCNTVFALRMSNDRDQEIVTSAIADTGSGLLEFLPALGQREAIAFGDGVTLPARIHFDTLPANALPRSSSARFSDQWQKSIGDEGFLDQVVERWRASGLGAGMDVTHQVSAFADAMGIPGSPSEPVQPEPRAAAWTALADGDPAPPIPADALLNPRQRAVDQRPPPQLATGSSQSGRLGAVMRRDAAGQPQQPAAPGAPRSSLLADFRNGAASAHSQNDAARPSLRERLLRQPPR